MVHVPLNVTRCTPHRLPEALALVLSDIAPSQRREIARGLLETEDSTELSTEPLYVALRGERLCGAAWGQRQSGNIATFWPPQLAQGEGCDVAVRLAREVMCDLDHTAIEMTQTLLPTDETSLAPLLQTVGFRHLVDLLYMSCEADMFPVQWPTASELVFEPYNGKKRDRLIGLIERTYEQTLDCVGLNGMRTVDDVLNGYQATGVYRPENWQVVRSNGADVGLLLLADHPQARHWELMYMGLTPEVRGRGWGGQIAQHAKWLAQRANVERIVLAVDSTNTPALRMYRRAAFETWDRRSVYVRFPGAAEA